MTFDIEGFTLRAGLGLEAEDRLLLGSHMVRGQHGGLFRLFNERYFQFIVWRALTPKWDVKVEHDYHDLVVFDSQRNYAAVFEMKPWKSADGKTEIPGIIRDVDKLVKRSSPVKGMIIFSANARGCFSANVNWLEEQIPSLEASKRTSFVFDTLNDKGCEIEFWLGIWLL